MSCDSALPLPFCPGLLFVCQTHGQRLCLGLLWHPLPSCPVSSSLLLLFLFLQVLTGHNLPPFSSLPTSVS